MFPAIKAALNGGQPAILDLVLETVPPWPAVGDLEKASAKLCQDLKRSRSAGTATPCCQREIEMLRVLCRHFTPSARAACDALAPLCRAGDRETAQLVTELSGLTAQGFRSRGCDPLKAACCEGQLETAQWLAERFGLVKADILQEPPREKAEERVFSTVVLSGMRRLLRQWFESTDGAAEPDLGWQATADWLVGHFALTSAEVRAPWLAMMAGLAPDRRVYSLVGAWLRRRFALTEEQIGAELRDALSRDKGFDALLTLCSMLADALCDDALICYSELGERQVYIYDATRRLWRVTGESCLVKKVKNAARLSSQIGMKLLKEASGNCAQAAVGRALDKISGTQGKLETDALGQPVSLSSQWAKRRLAEMDPHLEIDQAAELIAIRAGQTVNLAAGEARPRERGDFFSNELGAGYDPRAPTAQMEKFAGELMCGDPELTAFLQEVLGYLLLGGNPEKLLFICQSSGDSGLATLFRLLKAVEGDFAADFDDRLSFRGNNVSNRVYDPYELFEELVGKRLVMHESVLPVARTLEILLHDRPALKLLFRADEDPKFPVDSPLWSKIVPIPLRAHFARAEGERQADPCILDKLATPEGLSGVLNWMLAGARRYLSRSPRGLALPSQILAMREKWHAASDYLARFLSERTQHDAGGKILSVALFHAYEAWCAEKGIRHIYLPDFEKEMSRHFKRETQAEDPRSATFVGLVLNEL